MVIQLIKSSVNTYTCTYMQSHTSKIKPSTNIRCVMYFMIHRNLFFFPFKWILFGKWICIFVNQKLSKRIKQKKRKQQQTRCVKSLFIIKMEIYYCAGLNVIIWMSCPKVFCTKHWYCRKLSLVKYLMNSIALLMLFSARILDGMWFCVAYKYNNSSKRYLLAIIWSYYGMCPFLFLST